MINTLFAKTKLLSKLIVGTTASGKTTFIKEEINSILFDENKKSNDKIYILSSDRDYISTILALKNVGINTRYIDMNSDFHMNPFDINLNNMYENVFDSLSLKSDYIMFLCETMLINQNRNRLSPIECSIIDRCVRNIYLDKQMNIVNSEVSPTINEFYKELIKQPELEAQNLAMLIKPFQNNFANHTSYKKDIENNQVILYDIKISDTNKENTYLRTYLYFYDIWNKIISNYNNGFSTRIYLDDIDMLLNSDSFCDFFHKFCKKLRKYSCTITIVNNDINNLIKTDAGISIVNICTPVILKQISIKNKDILKKIYRLNDFDFQNLEQASLGQGLFYDNDKQNFVWFDNYEIAKLGRE